MASYCTFICNLFFYSTSSLWDSSRDVCSSLCFHSFIHCMNISHFIHEFFGWCNAGCFQLLTIAINAAVNILVHISMGTCKRIALRIYLAISESKSMHIFSFPKYCQIALQSNCSNLYSYQNYMSPYVLNPSQHFVLSDFKVFADLMNGCTLVTKK